MFHPTLGLVFCGGGYSERPVAAEKAAPVKKAAAKKAKKDK